MTEQIETERLILRPPRFGEGAEINAAIRESLAELAPWMPWAREAPTVEQTEANLRSMLEQFENQGVDVLLTGTFGLWPDETYGEPGYELLPRPVSAFSGCDIIKVWAAPAVCRSRARSPSPPAGTISRPGPRAARACA